MAGASDKARFYLEQSVPELQELSRKKIFSKDEITSIARKRSDWEHKLNARGCAPSDYARYAEYEMNLESLRRKRMKRLGVKTSNHTGQRRIFFVLDRATKKFGGDIGVWMQYLGFARKQRSNKKVSQILTSVLRLHPTKAELWICAASYAMEERGDMTEARSYMQRGLRFCKRDGSLWVEYARLEMMYIAKIVGRRKILGLAQDQEEVEGKTGEAMESINGDVVALPTNTAEDINPEQRPSKGIDQEALEKLGASPALSGAIPMAIFDSAIQHFDNNQELCLQFFDMVAVFHDLPCTSQILNHVMEAMQNLASESPATLIRFIQQPVIGVNPTGPGFPTQLGLCLDRMKLASERLAPILTEPKTARPRGILDAYVVEWMLPLLEQNDIDPDIRKVIEMTLRKVWGQFQTDTVGDPSGRAAEASKLIRKLQAQGLRRITKSATAWALETWPKEPHLFSQSVED